MGKREVKPKKERKTPEERERWFAMMRKIEQLMCKKCHSIPCLCTQASD